MKAFVMTISDYFKLSKRISSPRASDIAKLIALKFLEDGNFVSAGSPTVQPFEVTTQLASFGAVDLFSNLAVQAIGFAESHGKQSIQIFLNSATASALNRLPQTIGELPVEVHKIGRVQVKPQNTTSNMGNVYFRNGRVCCGSSCAPSGRQYSGTLGAMATDSTGTIFAVSNNHIIGDCNHTPLGMPIMSPSSSDGRPGLPPKSVASHERIIELRSGIPFLVAPCTLDVAMARVDVPSEVSSWQGGDPGFDTPTAVKDPEIGMKVKKFGRTTGLTEGTIASNVVLTQIPYDSGAFKGKVWFEDIWVVRSANGSAFAAPGDSGALVVTEDEEYAVGLIFGGNSKGDFVNIMPISKVLFECGGLTLLSSHGV